MQTWRIFRQFRLFPEVNTKTTLKMGNYRYTKNQIFFDDSLDNSVFENELFESIFLLFDSMFLTDFYWLFVSFYPRLNISASLIEMMFQPASIMNIKRAFKKSREQ